MLRVLLVSLLLTTTASAKTFPGQWDGKCTTIPPINENHKRNPNIWKGKGYIPPGMEETTEDISTCIPPASQGMGPK